MVRRGCISGFIQKSIYIVYSRNKIYGQSATAEHQSKRVKRRMPPNAKQWKWQCIGNVSKIRGLLHLRREVNIAQMTVVKVHTRYLLLTPAKRRRLCV